VLLTCRAVFFRLEPDLRNIAFFTSTRAEYGLLKPIMIEVASRPGLTLQLIVSGTHLSIAHGETWREIVGDGFSIDAQIDMGLAADDALSVAKCAATVLSGTAEALVRLKPDMIVLLGDRYELLAVAQAAVLTRVPIAHIHGGEATEGAIDEIIRHSVTKLSQWHFAAAEPYAQRIRQMGEAAERVWCVGAPAMDNIYALDPIPLEDMETFLGFKIRKPAFLVTYHPVTTDFESGLSAITLLLDALNEIAGSAIITGSNADPGASGIRATLQAFAREHPHKVVLIESLGTRRYLSLMRHVDAVVGNSSSGILEAPVMGVPTVDIGPRQQGRLSAPSVIHCGEDARAIRTALQKAISAEHRAVAATRESPYGSQGVARRVVDVLQSVDTCNRMKVFVDLRTTSVTRSPND